MVSFVIEPSVSIFQQFTLEFKHETAVESVDGSTESRESIFMSVSVRLFEASILNFDPLLLYTVTWVPELPQNDAISTPPVLENVQ